MRYVTICRKKSFVASLISAKIYVEDPMYGTTKINNISCRKLGELRNGQEETFQVSEDRVKIFVIGDKLSKGFCNEFYQLEAGAEPVTLTGQNVFNLASGNAFRFDNNDNPEVLENRKKGKKIGVWVLIAAALVGFLIGFLQNSNLLAGAPEPKTFTTNGMSITLTDEFEPMEEEGFTACYVSNAIGVMTIEEAFSLAPGFEDYTVEEYGELAIEVFELDSQLVKENDLCYFEYDAESEATSYHYYCFLYKEYDAFWMIQMACYDGAEESMEGKIMDYAKSVTFTP